jgi:H+/Cl- antiporter ClcA
VNLLRLQALFKLLMRHASSYVELGAAAAAEIRNAWARRIVLLLVGLIAGLVGVVALWATGLVALWDSDWRLAYVAGSAMVLLVTAAGTLWGALARRPAGPSSDVLQSELRKDMELFQEWKSTL